MTTSDREPRTAIARFATVRLAGTTGDELPFDFSEQLRPALVTGAAVTRHRREWRLGKVRDVAGRPNVVSGQIGFVDARDTTVWDEDEQDFVTGSVPDGTSFPFVLDLRRGVLGYQAKASSGVLSALQALLNAHSPAEWRVQRILNELTWSSWRDSVRVVKRLTFTLHLPNPDWVGRERVEQLMEGSRAGLAKVVLEADDDAVEGLDLQNEWVQQLVAHTEERGYGTLKADGEMVVGDQEVERRYDSAAKGAEEVHELTADTTGIISPAALSDAVANVVDDALQETVDDEDAAQ